MHEIFISYSSKHRDQLRTLVEKLEQQYRDGSVWWDLALESREQYGAGIDAALEAAKVVIVVWSPGARDSDWVYAEASKARRASKAVHVRAPELDADDLPLPFNAYHVDELDDLTGILRTVDQVWRGIPVPTRIPLHELYARRHGRALVDHRQDPLPREPGQLLPTDLLQARHGVVGFLDVGGVRDGLVDWCLTTGRRAAGRLVHGPGGVGKTRLLAEVAAALREQHGWTAGFLDSPREASAVDDLWQALEQLAGDEGERGGLLLVVDYAENRQADVTRLAGLLAARAGAAERPVRLLLATRTAGQWWTDLHDEQPDLQRLFRLGAGVDGPLALEPLAGQADREALFRAALARFRPHAPAIDLEPPTTDPGPDWLARLETGPGYGRPLAIQMLALLWLASEVPDPAGGMGEVLDRILGLERSRWQRLLGELDRDARRDLGRAVAQVTLVQRVETGRMLIDLLMTDRFYGDQRSRADADETGARASVLYGAAGAGCGALEPDLLGEHHVAAVADPELLDGCLTWLEERGLDDGQRQERAASLITVLQRAMATEHGETAAARARALLEHLVRHRTQRVAAPLLSVARAAPETLLPLLDAAVDDVDEPALAALVRAVPERSVVLDDLLMRAAMRWAAARRAHVGWMPGSGEPIPDDEVERARDFGACIGTLAIRLGYSGRREEALAASEEAVGVYRELARSRPDAFLPDLASSLNNLSGDLSALGRREEALAASEEAVGVYRELARSRPDAFLPDLASSLNNLSGDLSALGRREEALAASEEAVAIRRELARSRPDAFLPDLATSLGAMGQVLSAEARHAEAATAVAEGLAAIEPLLRRHAQAFSQLAQSLGSELLRHSQAAGIEPDTALLERVGSLLGASEDPPEVAALKAKVQAIIEAAQESGQLDETALAELPDALAEQLRAAWAEAQSGSEDGSARE